MIEKFMACVGMYTALTSRRKRDEQGGGDGVATTYQLRRSVGTYAYSMVRVVRGILGGEETNNSHGKGTRFRWTYMTDPVGRFAYPFPFQHTHAPKKERDGHWTEKRLIHVYLEGDRSIPNVCPASTRDAKGSYPINQRFSWRIEL